MTSLGNPRSFVSVQMFDAATNNLVVNFTGTHVRPDELEKLVVESFRTWYRQHVHFPEGDTYPNRLEVKIS